MALSHRRGAHAPDPQELDSQVRRGPSAQRVERSLFRRLNNYLGLHFQTLSISLLQLARTPLASVMTAAVIGIALALPATLHVFLDKVQALSSGWRESTQISMFLNADVSDAQAAALAQQLLGWNEIAKVDHITPTQAWEDFRRQSGLGDALGLLDTNPLPGVLVVTPSQAYHAPDQAELLLSRLKMIDQVDLAQMDMEWVERLHGLVVLADRGVTALAVLLAMAVLFVIGNTIRLSIQNRHAEIEVIKLIGGSDGFVRRPFLYTGMWFGLFGGLLAWGLINALLFMLQTPVSHLAALYGSQYRLGMVDVQTTLLLLLSGPLLGLTGSWLAAWQRIRTIEPR